MAFDGIEVFSDGPLAYLRAGNRAALADLSDGWPEAGVEILRHPSVRQALLAWMSSHCPEGNAFGQRSTEMPRLRWADLQLPDLA
jgi:hypothetical protein